VFAPIVSRDVRAPTVLCMTDIQAGQESDRPIFNWDALKEIGPHDLGYKTSFKGKIYEVELTNRYTVKVWRADDGRQYFCHGLTFGGKNAPGGPISPFTGKPVETILRHYYRVISEVESRPADILVWKGVDPDSTPHSAILTDAIILEGKGYLADNAVLRSKNGIQPEASLTLDQLNQDYGETYNVYRRQ
jgi:hypothetical protein